VLAGIALASAAATLVNPYGWGLWQFLAETVRLERPDIPEWEPILRNRELLIPWLVTVALALWAAVRRPRPDLPYLAICLLLAVAAFKVSRLGAFFSLSVGLLLLAPLPSAGSAVRVPSGSRAATFTVGAAVAVFVFGVAVMSAPARISCLRPPERLQLDPEATAFILDNRLEGRLVVWFDWGEFALWHFAPALKVSMDGRRETVYSASTLNRHNDLYVAAGGARAYLDSLDADYAWLPPRLPLNQKLEEWGWHRVFESPRSVLWSARTMETPPRGVRAIAPCFPGP
jgi:hypothetical protein